MASELARRGWQGPMLPNGAFKFFVLGERARSPRVLANASSKRLAKYIFTNPSLEVRAPTLQHTVVATLSVIVTELPPGLPRRRVASCGVGVVVTRTLAALCILASHEQGPVHGHLVFAEAGEVLILLNEHHLVDVMGEEVATERRYQLTRLREQPLHTTRRGRDGQVDPGVGGLLGGVLAVIRGVISGY
jgi:hypothetical protein